MGSAFLRHAGIACRHGYIDDGTQAASLIGDCEVVANFALASGSPREAHERNRRIISNTIRHASRDATVILFSTASVYRGRASSAHAHSAYSREKLACENLALSLGKRHRRRVVVCRLGHVTGELQGLSQHIRAEVRQGPIVLPFPDRSSNTTHVVGICEAIAECARRKVPGGVYDLLNVPQWTWREVVEYEAERAGAALRLVLPRGAGVGLSRSMKTLARVVYSSPAAKERLLRLLTRFSPAFNARAKVLHWKARAAAEIAQLEALTPLSEAMLWNEVGENPLPHSTDTKSLLRDGRYASTATGRPPWPADLRMAQGR
jgi:nucleoside-diphosphate-sugar epimerase